MSRLAQLIRIDLVRKSTLDIYARCATVDADIVRRAGGMFPSINPAAKRDGQKPFMRFLVCCGHVSWEIGAPPYGAGHVYNDSELLCVHDASMAGIYYGELEESIVICVYPHCEHIHGSSPIPYDRACYVFVLRSGWPVLAWAFHKSPLVQYVEWETGVRPRKGYAISHCIGSKISMFMRAYPNKDDFIELARRGMKEPLRIAGGIELQYCSWSELYGRITGDSCAGDGGDK